MALTMFGRRFRRMAHWRCPAMPAIEPGHSRIHCPAFGAQLVPVDFEPSFGTVGSCIYREIHMTRPQQNSAVAEFQHRTRMVLIIGAIFMMNTVASTLAWSGQITWTGDAKFSLAWVTDPSPKNSTPLTKLWAYERNVPRSAARPSKGHFRREDPLANLWQVSVQ
jgi:hypothetical protein